MCTYKPKEKAQLKSMRKDLAPVVQFSTEDNLKLDTQNEFDTTLITPYQKVRTTMQIQHNKIASEMDENKTNQNAISQEQNIFTPLITLNCQNIATQPPVPKQFFASLERISPNMPRQSQKNVGTSSQKLLQTKLVEQNRDIQIESGPSLLTPYQKQFRNMKGESQNILNTALITPHKKEYSTLSQNDPQVYLDDTQLSSSSASLSDDIFSPNMPNSFSSEVFTPIEDKNQEIDRQALDPAELYDEKNKYIPQAGTSKFTDAQKLTQISESSDEISTPKPISLNSNGSIFTENELKLSANSGKDSEKSSEIDPVAPYQKENVGFEVGEGLCKSKIESSGSEITPYQKEQNLHRSDLILTTCLNIFEFADQNLPSESGCKIIVPKFQPPSRDFIEATMQEFNIPMESHQEPFYSDVKDVTGPMEVGVRILKIPSNKIVDITEFESSFKGINCYRKALLEHMYPNEKITNRDIYNYKMSFCKSTNCIIIPAKLPPSREEVELWLKSKLEKKQNILKVIARKKIIIPCSPGADNCSDDSLTVSPCASLDETLKNVRKITEDETSKSSLETIFDNTSTIIKKTDSLKCHRKGISQNSSLKSNQSSENTFNSQELDTTKQRRRDSCQITGVTLDRTNNFAISCDNLQNAKAVSEYLHLTVFSMELIIETRNDYKPNPSHDAIKGIVYQIFNDVPEDDLRKRSVKGCFLLNNMPISPTRIKFSIVDGIFINNDETTRIFETETDMMTKFVEFLVDCDPDILIGYEIQMLSWGYLIERGYTLNLNLISLLSRVPQSTKSKPEDDLSDLTIPGRIILDFWRLLRHEIALQSYTFENIVYHILHQRVPLYSFRNITFWWNHVSGLYRNKVLRYYFYRVEAILRIMDQLDLIGRTSELAKLFGIQFFEVLSRGSQFRVESMMLRLAKPLNYIPVSPSVQQRASMRAPESLPLIMEPESKFYVDPVIVLDFQSLYPSMIIAYNYCFSTCLGRIEHLGHDIPFEFGATQLKVPRKYIKRLSRKDLINISPCGVGFVKKTVREGILPRMLQEILDTRLMVKKSLKKNAGNKTLEKVLDARQLGLKLIANVTYGYTAANFSGRMPCIEVGDSVVSKGRETLQRAINLVEKTPKWGAKVVYGDTDSIFVLVPGKSRQEAFKIGAEIAEAVTNDNPSPVKLKLEKVFHPCILQTKKRYVGYMYESPEQDEPEYLAKGIETVRRDGCPAVAKVGTR
ncbi:hypothetical protein AMK59_4402 [Oryctes borbonicus]|uniref:DNA polymerase n=1 Tax=Oryctes borbonicus TaxID=1629725 RepID=A0A0T6B458_9SCAR|nr:hypothetical protein AMK59_4402 [Oryctes borbonicus]